MQTTPGDYGMPVESDQPVELSYSTKVKPQCRSGMLAIEETRIRGRGLLLG